MKKVIAHGKLTTNDSDEATSVLINKTFSNYDINFMDYGTLVKICHKFPRYFNIPKDTLEDIVLICEGQTIPKGKNRLDIALSYLEFARTKNISKKFDLTNKQKQLLFSAVGFLNLYKSEGNVFDKNTAKLYDFINRIATRYSDDIEQQLEFAYKQFSKITGEKDVLVDHLAFSMSMCFAFVETEPDVDKKILDKILSLSTKIFNKQEKLYGNNESFKTSLRLVGKFTENIIEIH